MNHLDSILESIQCSSPRLSGDCSIDTSCDDSGSNNNSNNDNGSNTVGASSLSSVNNIDTTGNSSAVQSKLSEQQQEWGHRPTASSFSLATTAVVANTSPSMNNSAMDEATAAKMYQQAMNDDGDNDVSFPMEAVYEEGSLPLDPAEDTTMMSRCRWTASRPLAATTPTTRHIVNNNSNEHEPPPKNPTPTSPQHPPPHPQQPEEYPNTH
eukprot:g3984.t1 g3984   contig15:77690-78319(+)